MVPTLTEIDLAQTTNKGGAGLEVGPTYLVLHRGRFHCGTFSTQWYGLNFNGIYPAGCQYDPPGTNASDWQKIWRIDNADEIAASLELDYAERQRRYAIDHRLESNGQTITEQTPLGAFLYVQNRKVPAMPKRDEDDWDED